MAMRKMPSSLAVRGKSNVWFHCGSKPLFFTTFVLKARASFSTPFTAKGTKTAMVRPRNVFHHSPKALAKRTRNDRVRVDNLGHVRQLASIDYLLNERELVAIRRTKLLRGRQ